MIILPTMSAGIRSGVNWMREYLRCSTRESVLKSVVFPSPGTPSNSTCPPARRQIRTPSTTSCWPTMIFPISLRAWSSCAVACSRTASNGTQPFYTRYAVQKGGSTMIRLPVVLLVTAALLTAQNGHGWRAQKTSDGQPDLQGYWTNSTLTPLERPRDLAGKPFFTEPERAQRERNLLANLSTDRRDGPPEVDVNRSYNELFRERGGLLLQTSLIIDPPDGRLPPLTPDAKKREDALAADRRKRGGDPADSWEDRNLAERCITRGAPKLPGGYNNNFQIVQT